MTWAKHTIKLDPIVVEMRKRIPTGNNGFTTVDAGEDEVIAEIVIDTGKIRTLARRAAASKNGKATLHFGAITARVVSRKQLRRV